MSEEITDILDEEFEFQGQPSYRKFANWITEGMSKEGDTLSHATLINWRNEGKMPDTDFLQNMLSIYPITDRRFRLALRLLAAKSPHVWGFGGVVWNLNADLKKLSKG